MWIYAHVEGEVHEYFDDVVVAIAELEQQWNGRGEAATLRGLFERLRASLPPAAELVRYGDARPEQRAAARVAYLAHLELAAFLEAHCPRGEASYVVQDCLEEWQPYICIEDAAENLVRLDGVDRATAIAAMQRDAALPPAEPFDDDCPLCRELAAAAACRN